MPHTIEEFKDIENTLKKIVFGDKTDKLLDQINTFMVHLENIRHVWSANHFPLLLLNLVYFPCYYTIMIWNCMRESLIWWIVAIILTIIVTAAFGALVGGVYVLWRGYNIYFSRFDWDGNIIDPQEMARAKAKA